MANKKFSQFTVQTELLDFDGLVGFQSAAIGGNDENYYISPANLNADLEKTLNLTNFQLGALSVERGGTGLGDLSTGQLLVGQGINSVTGLDITTKGTIAVGDGTGIPNALGIGIDGDILTADSNEASGLKWTNGGGAKRRFITTAVFRNLFGSGSPITGTTDIAQFGYVSTEDNPSLFIATSAVKLIKIGFKWLGGDTTGGIGAGDAWEIFAYPLTSANLNADAAASYGAGETTGLILDQNDNGTYPGKTNTLTSPISMSAGQMWAFAGVETGIIGTASAEAIIWLEFEEV